MTHTMTSCIASLASAAVLCMPGTAALAQAPVLDPATPAFLQDAVNKAYGIKSDSGELAKGWTCIDPEDGKRMHVMDRTNIARMKGVRSSVAGFRDTTTPLEKLPPCTRPE